MAWHRRNAFVKQWLMYWCIHLCSTGGNHYPEWSTHQRRWPHGENNSWCIVYWRWTSYHPTTSFIMIDNLQSIYLLSWNDSVLMTLLLLSFNRREVYRTLRTIYPDLACRQFLGGLQQLERECGYGEDSIPQLREVSAFLKGEAQQSISAWGTEQ